MSCSNANNLTLRRAVVLAVLLLVVSTGSADCCQNCESRMSREGDDTELSVRRLAMKKDIFMSRGWGAGGGTDFVSRTNSDLYGKNRMVVEMMISDDDKYEHPLGPRIEFLRSPSISKPATARRRLPTYVPHLFISSGWGPLGK